jgi:hypothetical protein
LIAALAGSPLDYTTLNFGTSRTFLTGIRGNDIVGDYVAPGTTETDLGAIPPLGSFLEVSL